MTPLMKSSLLVLIVAFLSCFKFGEEVSEDECLSDINSRTITYSVDIAPVISNNCLSCHNSTPVSPATQPLTNATEVQNLYNAANDPKSLGIIARLSGTSYTMPPDGSLGNCDIEKMKKWQSDGFQ